MKFTRLSAAAALLAACIAATAVTPAFAAGEPRMEADHERGPGGHGPGAPGPDMPFGRMPLHGLKLSDAQQDKLFAIMHAQAPERREHEKAIRKAHEALRELSRADKFDDAKAGALARDLGQAAAAAALLRARTEAQALAVLTPEQRDQLRQRRMRRREAEGQPDRR